MNEAKKARPEKKAKKPKLRSRIAKWFRELISELGKVTWPTPKQVINNTWVALVVIIVCAIGLWIFDYVAQILVRLLIDLFG